MNLTAITFKDLEDLKQFIEAINSTEGQRLGFSLTIHDTKKGKRIK
jgi:hypothetical protein